MSAVQVRIFAAIQDPLMAKISSGSQVALISIVQEAVICNLKALEQQQQRQVADGKAPEKQLIEIALSRDGRLSTRISSSISVSSIDHHQGDDELSAGLQRLGPVLSLINAVSSRRASTVTGEKQGVHEESLVPSPHYWTSKCCTVAAPLVHISLTVTSLMRYNRAERVLPQLTAPQGLCQRAVVPVLPARSQRATRLVKDLSAVEDVSKSRLTAEYVSKSRSRRFYGKS